MRGWGKGLELPIIDEKKRSRTERGGVYDAAQKTAVVVLKVHLLLCPRLQHRKVFNQRSLWYHKGSQLAQDRDSEEPSICTVLGR